VHPVRKTLCWIKKWLTPFRIVTTFCVSMQSLGRSNYTRAGCIGAEIGVSCMSRLVCLRVGDIVQTSIVWWFMDRFLCHFQHFFSEWIALPEALHNSHFFIARWRHNLREIAVKNCKKSKNWRKRLCAPLLIDSWGIWKKNPLQ